MPDQVDWRAMEREASPGRAVGRLLRDQRETLGLSLSDIGQRLRIRRPYIEAIESGRFDELPGAAYIPAFLRAYAVHLGLDPEKVLSAYHSSGAVPIERPLALPADFPLAEKRAPFGLAVLTVLMVIAAGYAVWHFLPRETHIVAEKVPPVPDRLLASRPANDSASATSVAAPPDARPVQTQSPPAEMWPLPKSEAVAPPAIVNAPVVNAPVVNAPVINAPAVAAPAVAPPPVIAAPVAAPPAAPMPPLAPTATIGQAQAAQPPAAPRIDVLRGAPSATDEARATAPEFPRTEVSLPVRRDTPIGVRVDSWVELRAPNGDVLAQTYVRAGESYTIPAGIAFRVINAR